MRTRNRLLEPKPHIPAGVFPVIQTHPTNWQAVAMNDPIVLKDSPCNSCALSGPHAAEVGCLSRLPMARAVRLVPSIGRSVVGLLKELAGLVGQPIALDVFQQDFHQLFVLGFVGGQCVSALQG